MQLRAVVVDIGIILIMRNGKLEIIDCTFLVAYYSLA